MEVTTALVASSDLAYREKTVKNFVQTGIPFVAQAAIDHRLPRLMKDFPIDVLLLDFVPSGGIACDQLPLLCHAAPIVLLAVIELSEEDIESCLRQGVRGFVSRNGNCEEYAHAIDAIRHGDIWLSRHKLANALLRLIEKADRPDVADRLPPRRESLSPRETEIAEMIRRGWTNKQIARAIGSSDKTIKAHVSHIFAKLGLSRRIQLCVSSLPGCQTDVCKGRVLLKNSMSQSSPSPTKDDFLKRAPFGARNRV
jgi:DNA-binding NarL/FixJ family response regulator